MKIVIVMLIMAKYESFTKELKQSIYENLGGYNKISCFACDESIEIGEDLCEDINDQHCSYCPINWKCTRNVLSTKCCNPGTLYSDLKLCIGEKYKQLCIEIANSEWKD